MASVQSSGRVWKRDLSGPDLSSLLAFILIAVVLVTWGLLSSSPGHGYLTWHQSEVQSVRRKQWLRAFPRTESRHKQEDSLQRWMSDEANRRGCCEEAELHTREVLRLILSAKGMGLCLYCVTLVQATVSAI